MGLRELGFMASWEAPVRGMAGLEKGFPGWALMHGFYVLVLVGSSTLLRHQLTTVRCFFVGDVPVVGGVTAKQLETSWHRCHDFKRSLSDTYRTPSKTMPNTSSSIRASSVYQQKGSHPSDDPNHPSSLFYDTTMPTIRTPGNRITIQ